MTSLHELQTRFMDALLGDSPDRAIPLIASPAPVAAARLEVYRNTVRSNVVDALRSTYPVIWRLVGESYFRRVTGEFGSQYPSRSGDLRHRGDRFPAHLAELHHDDEYRYLGDVARLELLIQDAWLAPEHPPLDLARLAAVAPEAYEDLRFIVHPALRLFESPYPVRRIWESNIDPGAEPEPIDLTAGGDLLAVLPHRLQLRFHGLGRGEWVLLDAMSRGERFAASVDAAAARDAEFDAAAALHRFVALEAIVDFM